MLLRLITPRCNETNINTITTVNFVPEIPTSGPAKGLHGLDSHSGISVAAVINVHECRSCVITAHARSPELSSVSFVRFPFIIRYRTRVPVDLSLSMSLETSRLGQVRRPR